MLSSIARLLDFVVNDRQQKLIYFPLQNGNTSTSRNTKKTNPNRGPAQQVLQVRASWIKLHREAVGRERGLGVSMRTSPRPFKCQKRQNRPIFYRLKFILGSKARENKTKKIILGSAMNTTFLWFYSPMPLLLKCCENKLQNRIYGYMYI